MRQKVPHLGRRALGLTAALGLVATAASVASVPAAAAPPVDRSPAAAAGDQGDNLTTPLRAKRDALLKRALADKLKGVPSAQGKVAKVGKAGNGKNQFVQLEREGTDRVFVVIAEFGDTRHPSYPDTNPDGTPASNAQRFDGPMHNEIPEPDRSVDNSTLWQPNYDQAHYRNMYFTRMDEYFQRQSSGRYAINGSVTEWVKVPFNQARYGRDFCGGNVCNNTWFLLRDALAYWTEQQLASGQSMAQVRNYLKTFDKQDRNDFDGDGNFDEPDGFIDHMQVVHAGGDAADGDPIYGTDAIWSHRWNAVIHTATGPVGGAQIGGFDIGEGGLSGGIVEIPNNPTGVWVNDYTIQPENGGLSVFAHEYTHDLGIDDLYDTSGNTGGGENSVGHWSLMSQSRLGNKGPTGIGDKPADLGGWEKFHLGWLSAQGTKGPFYGVASSDATSTHRLGRNTPATKDTVQTLFTLLPDKARTDVVGVPASGSKFFFSGTGNDLNNTMAKTSGISGTALTAKVRYSIEPDFDYAFVEASTNGGATWLPVMTNLSRSAATDQSGLNASGTGMTGDSAGYAAGTYVDLTATLPAGTNALRFRYATDGGLSLPGFSVDDIAVDGTAVGTAETDEGWTFDGFSATTGTSVSMHFNAYVAENRRFDGYDETLRRAYNFGFLNTRPDWVEKYRYQPGMLVSYWDESFDDNSVGDHPGGGLILPVDAHPNFVHAQDGTLIRPRILAYDATFGLDRTEAVTLHLNGVPFTLPSQPAAKVFDDTVDYWFNADQHAATGSHVGRYQPGWHSVNLPKTGTTITVQSVGGIGNIMTVKVAPK